MSLKKINRTPIVVQKLDPKMLELKKSNIDLRITIHKMQKVIDEQKKQIRKSKIIMKKMDCVIHVLTKESSKKNFVTYFIINLDLSGSQILEEAKKEEDKRKEKKGPLTVFADLS